MAVYACGCLNVKIHVREVQPVVDPESIPFLGHKVGQVMLDDQGIVIEQSYLLHRESSPGGWVHYQCINCNWRTHAVCSINNSSTVVINLQMESDPTVLLRQSRSIDFSAAFNIILNDFDMENTEMQDASVYESVVVSQVQDQATQYLEQEKAAMEERIRTFEHEQRLKFAEIQARCQKEKSHMVSLLLKAASGEEKPRHESKPGLTERRHSPILEQKSKSKASSGRLDLAKRSYSEYDQNPDSEALFFLDELEPELEEPFYDTDEEDDMIGHKIGSNRSNNQSSDYKQHNLFSTSVPISVPMWKGRRSSSTEEEEEEEVTPANPDEIAANMQALAESIPDTGRYIFGDRPRPRLNTGDSLAQYADHPRRRLNTADSVYRRK